MRHLFASISLEDRFEEVVEANLRYALQNDLLRSQNDKLRKDIRQLRNITVTKLLKQNKKLKHSIHKAYNKYIKKEEPQMMGIQYTLFDGSTIVIKNGKEIYTRLETNRT